MRRIIVSAFTSLDSVMQAPGGPEEDPTGGFRYGGWVAPYWEDEALGSAMGELFAAPFDLLLGRRTYDIFAAHWPFVQFDPAVSDFDAVNAKIAEAFNNATKYVATHRPESLAWRNSQDLGGDVAASLRALKSGDGPDLLVQGSSELIQLLLSEDLIDDLHLLLFPLVFGQGKRLFGSGTIPAAFELVNSRASPKGVVMASYRRAGDIPTGSFALDAPSEAELVRRSTLT
jgi:dihydrofolate reductase